MSDSFGFVVAVAATWVAIGVVLSIVMGRMGHNSFAWFVLGSLFGPLGVMLAVEARRRGERLQPTPLGGSGSATTGPGPVDVLIGYDRSPESAGAIDAVVELLGDRLGRLTAATVVPHDNVREQEREANEGLGRLRDRTPGRALDLTVLHGHPSAALRQWAIEGGFELIAVGTRGTGISKTILGSTASELARDSKLPILLVGGDGAKGGAVRTPSTLRPPVAMPEP